MKRIILFLTALLMCLCLAACDQKAPAAPSGPQLPAVEGCEAVLRVQFNPEFELYLDAEGRVLQVNCLNSDAQNAFADCDVAGMEIGAALDILLTAAWEQEYLTDERTVTITPVAVAENSAVQTAIDAIPQTVETIRADLGGSFGITVNDAVIASAANTVDSGEYTVKVEKEGGSKVVKYYRSDGTLAERHEFRDGFTMIDYYRPNEVCFEHRRLNDDGSFEQHFCDIHGRIIAANYSVHGGTLADSPVNGGTLVTHDVEGRNTLLFRTDGTLASYRTDYSATSYLEKQYDADGMITKETDVFPGREGITGISTIVSTFTNNVRTSSTGFDSDGSTFTATYYPNGAPMYRERTYVDGSIDREWYVESDYEWMPARLSCARAKNEHVDPNGYMRREIREGDDELTEAFEYTADGTLERHETYTHFANGDYILVIENYLDNSVIESTYFAAGGHHSVERRPLEDGRTYVNEWTQDGPQSSYYILPDGTQVSSDYNSTE